MFLCGIERSLERRTDRQHDTRAGLTLPQADVSPVISRPRQVQEVALPLAGPQGKQERQMKMRWCRFALVEPEEEPVPQNGGIVRAGLVRP